MAALEGIWESLRGTGALHACWGSSWCVQKFVSLARERIWIFGWVLLGLRLSGRCAALRAEVKVPAARWLSGECVGRNRAKFGCFWREVEEFEVSRLFGAEGVYGGLWGVWVASG